MSLIPTRRLHDFHCYLSVVLEQHCFISLPKQTHTQRGCDETIKHFLHIFSQGLGERQTDITVWSFIRFKIVEFAKLLSILLRQNSCHFTQILSKTSVYSSVNLTKLSNAFCSVVFESSERGRVVGVVEIGELLFKGIETGECTICIGGCFIYCDDLLLSLVGLVVEKNDRCSGYFQTPVE